jgi:hypothetical protein
MFDIVFISYNEPNADANYERLKQRFPLAKRVHGVQGIHNAHIAAARRCFTKMFWVVDGDAEVLESFNFDYEPDDTETDVVHVWRSQNPENGLMYGYGGVKLLPRKLTLNMRTDSVDMTLAISDKFKAMPEISNITAFNTDPFSTWRSSFRECCKLVQNDDLTSGMRYSAWITMGSDISIAGAIAGGKYGRENASNPEALRLINDFEWLKQRYQETQS